MDRIHAQEKKQSREGMPGTRKTSDVSAKENMEDIDPGRGRLGQTRRRWHRIVPDKETLLGPCGPHCDNRKKKKILKIFIKFWKSRVFYLYNFYVFITSKGGDVKILLRSHNTIEVDERWVKKGKYTFHIGNVTGKNC